MRNFSPTSLWNFSFQRNGNVSSTEPQWVCQSTDEQRKRDAIIVLAAKIRKAGMDEIPVYKKHLEKKQKYQAPNGQQVISEPRYVKVVVINSKKWIDSLHLQSEIPDFFTRYLATVEADLGMLITFSVRKGQICGIRSGYRCHGEIPARLS